MPLFNLDINGSDKEAYEGYETWSGPTPKPGVYDAKLKVAQITVIDPEGRSQAKNSGKNRIKIGCELAGNTGELAQYNGFTAWGGVNLIEESIGYVNQWLKALTDGTEDEFVAIKDAFYNGKLIVDEKKEHIDRIGPWRVESPNGELPIKVSLKTRNRTIEVEDPDNPGHKKPITRVQVEIGSFLVRSGAASSASGGESNSAVAAAEPEEPDIDVDVDVTEPGVAQPSIEANPVGDDVFDDVPEPSNAG